MARWDDTEIDGLARRVGRTEDEVAELAKDLRSDIRDLKREQARRFDTIDGDHEQAKVKLDKAVGGVNWTSLGATAFAVAVSVGVPIATAIIASS